MTDLGGGAPDAAVASGAHGGRLARTARVVHQLLVSNMITFHQEIHKRQLVYLFRLKTSRQACLPALDYSYLARFLSRLPRKHG